MKLSLAVGRETEVNVSRCAFVGTNRFAGLKPKRQSRFYSRRVAKVNF